MTLQEESFKADASLSPQGVDYAQKMSETLLRHREEERAQLVKKGAPDAPLKDLIIWTSSRRRTIETSSYLAAKGYKVRKRSQMSQMNPGVCEKKSEKRIKEEYPDEVEKHDLDPYHHRFPRAEVRIKPCTQHTQELTYTVLSRCGGSARAHHSRA